LADGKDAARYLEGMRQILSRIKKNEWTNIEKASDVIARALQNGRYATFISEGHHPPLATSYGTSGHPHLLLPGEFLLQHFGFNAAVSTKGDVLVLAGQYDISPFLEPIAVHARLIDEYIIFIGTPCDRAVIPATLPGKTLPEFCDLSINVYTPPGDGLLKFDGLEISACPTSGITSVLMYHVLNAEIAERLSRVLGRRKKRLKEPIDQDIAEMKRALSRRPRSVKGVKS